MKKKFKLITLLLAFVLLFTPIFSSTVHATSYNGTDDESGQASGKYAGGPSYGRTGWLMYLVRNESDEVVSDVVAVSCGGAPQGVELMATRIGNMQYSRQFAGVKWASAVSPNGAPFDNLQHPNGAKIISWMLQDDGAGTENWYNVVRDYWGEEKALAMASEGYSLIMEPFYWANLGNGWVCANAKGWGQYMSAVYGSDSYGPSVFKRFTNGIFAHCAKFSTGKWTWGLTPYEGGSFLTNSDMEYYAVGIMSVTPYKNSIHTYDGVNSPGAAPETPKGKVNIVKSYHTVNETTGEDSNDGCYIRTSVTNNIIIDDEVEYQVEAWKVTTSDAVSIPGTDAGWNPPGTVQEEGNMPGNVEVTLPGKTLFVQLVRREIEGEVPPPDGYDYVIYESQVSRQVYISEAETNTSASEIKSREFIWKMPKLKEKCSGHDYISEHNAEVKDADGNVIGHEDKHDTAYCGPWQIVDSEIQAGLKNSLRNDFKNVLSNSWYKNPAIGDEELQDYDRGQDFSEHDFITTGWDESLILHRGNDKLTIAEWKGTGLDLANITDEEDMYAVANVPQNNRKSLNYMDTFNIEIKNNSPDVETVSAPQADSGHGICSKDSKNAKIDPYMISPLQVYIYVYSGKADGGFTNTDCQEGVMNSYSGGIHKSWVMLPTGTTFSFYPYIEMRYDTQSSKDNKVYVLSQFRRSLSTNDCAEIIWKDGSEGNLTLSSKQWSTHALATSGSDWRQADSVLPGGAIMNLGIKQSDRQVVTAKTYQVILEEEGRTQAEFAGSIAGMTEADAISYHEQFVSTVMTGLDNLSVEQWLNTSWSSSPFSGQIVSSVYA